MAISITKPVVGDDDGTWGGILNTALDALATAVPDSEVGAANGVATLDGSSKVPTGQIPNLSGSYDTAGAAATAQANAATYTDTAVATRVRFDASQSLTGGQKTQAQTNLGVADFPLVRGVSSVVYVEDYSAVGDCKTFADGVVNSGSSTLTSATANFVSGDVGKTILVANGTAPGSAPDGLVTTIQAVVNATTITMAANAGRNIASGARFTYGTDDTAAINNAVTAAVANAQTNGSYYAEVRFQAKTYMVAGALTSGSPTNGSAQIVLPIMPFTGRKLTLRLQGAGPSGLYHWNQVTPQLAGTALLSTQALGLTVPSANGEGSVIGGPTPKFGYGYPAGLFSNMLAVVDGLSVVVRQNPQICAFDFRGVAEMAVRHCSAYAYSYGTGAPASPDPNWAWGLYPPAVLNNAWNDIDDFSCEGFVYGLYLTELCRVSTCRIVNCYDGIVCFASSSASHGNQVDLAIVEYCQQALTNDGVAQAKVNINTLALEMSTALHQIQDTNNVLVGTVVVRSNGTGAQLNTSVLNDAAKGVNGAAKLRIINGDMAPGNVTAPTVPSSTTALKNPFWRDAVVTVTGGTVSAVAVDGVAQGYTATGFTIIVPTGKTVTLTYSSAPTWVWTLL